MKRGFTLVELLIVVMVIGILMGMVLRFGNIGIDVQRRNLTVTRMQRLENALSGYFAAFGTYPPVKLQGSRNYLLEVSDHGIQNADGQENASLWGWLGSDNRVSDGAAEAAAWSQVQAACEAQPVACYFPYSEDYVDYVRSYSEMMKSYAEQVSDDEIASGRKAVFAAGFDTGVPLGRFGSYRDETDWSRIQLFKFGLLSFLLPRYLFMMEGPRELFTDYAQWTGNNQLPADPLRGTSYAGGWERLRRDVREDLARVANVPSQAVCARWIANFKNSLTCARKLTFFGVDVMADADQESSMAGINTGLKIYSPGGFDNDSHAGQYVLNSVSLRDGWLNDFYYYSPAPYQSYVIWSSGPNGRTFPPWVSLDSLPSDAKRCVGYWTGDDIVSLKK